MKNKKNKYIMIDLKPSRLEMTTPAAVAAAAASQRDWFEFILDFSLLDRHLLVDQPTQPGKL